MLAGVGVVALGGVGVLALDEPLRSSLESSRPVSSARRRLGIGQVDASVPSAGGTGPVYATFASTARGRDVMWGWAGPPGRAARGLPVLLVLHGRAVDAHAAFTQLGMHEFLAAHVGAGGPPLAVVSVDGGSTYWHPRADGDDPLAMLTGELWPRLAAAGFDLTRWAVAGWSMGGFGALLLAREAAAGRFAPAARSWRRRRQPRPLRLGRRHVSRVLRRPRRLAPLRRPRDGPGTGAVSLSVSCGRDDPFRAQTQRYRDACHPTPAGGIGDGAHTTGYWRSLVPDWLRLAGAALTP